MQRKMMGRTAGRDSGWRTVRKMAALLWLTLGVAIGAAALGCGASQTKEEWWAKLEKGGFKYPANRLVVGKDRAKFLKVMGKPDRIQSVGDYTFWSYRCRDGQIQMVMQTWLLDNGQIATESINEY